uniref:Type III polyketide synthase pspB n=1 Tax=Penicillium soppii TaxID=69789 RepID=PSPB_PENSO|nr:RecName: Full=Type III polyketide synthase pspB; AltName: Full=Soppiline biosynthesis cluster protein B [Penicillium soppii]
MVLNHSPPPGLYITGLGSQYPPYLLGPEKLEEFAARFYDVESPGLKKLLQINRSSGIETRSAIRSYESGFATRPEAPTISELAEFYHQAGVDLTTQACKKALRESQISPQHVTHTIGVTCTNQGNPGFDLLVNRKLGLSANVDRMLLHGVGCAGGLAIMRAAAQIACGASMRRKPVRILAFACELCTPNVRHDLAFAEKAPNAENISIAGALFSDAAAAFVLCNEYAMAETEITPLFQLLEWGNSLIPDTVEHMAFFADVDGYRTVLTRDVPQYTKHAIGPMFEKLLPSYQSQIQSSSGEGVGEVAKSLGVSDFDWALHPGGEAIIEGAKQVLGLTEDQLQASREIYRTRGNSSSATVLIVLDRLRSLGKREYVVATSFGPGLAIEMAMLRRCEVDED